MGEVTAGALRTPGWEETRKKGKKDDGGDN